MIHYINGVPTKNIKLKPKRKLTLGEIREKNLRYRKTQTLLKALRDK